MWKVPDRARRDFSCLALCFLPYLPHLLADDSTDGIRGVLLHLCRGVSIGVQREPSRIVAQRAGQRFHVHAAFQGQRGEGVPEIMKPNVFRTDSFQNFIMGSNPVRVTNLSDVVSGV